MRKRKKSMKIKNEISPMLYFEHFSCKEFFPNCSVSEICDCLRNGYFDNILFLLMVLDAFRDFINKPIIITSTYRDENHNKIVGGSPTSQHLVGCAIDFVCPKIPFETLVYLFHDFCKESALDRFLGQVIFYHKSKFIHFGLRTPAHSQLKVIHYEKGNN